jgi:hypothetical protein
VSVEGDPLLLKPVALLAPFEVQPPFVNRVDPVGSVLNPPKTSLRPPGQVGVCAVPVWWESMEV